MLKKDELANPDSCLGRAELDEPVFVLRASDKFAPLLVRMWIGLANMHGAPIGKLVKAGQVAEAMERWPARKFPD